MPHSTLYTTHILAMGPTAAAVIAASIYRNLLLVITCLGAQQQPLHQPAALLYLLRRVEQAFRYLTGHLCVYIPSMWGRVQHTHFCLVGGSDMEVMEGAVEEKGGAQPNIQR